MGRYYTDEEEIIFLQTVESVKIHRKNFRLELNDILLSKGIDVQKSENIKEDIEKNGFFDNVDDEHQILNRNGKRHLIELRMKTFQENNKLTDEEVFDRAYPIIINMLKGINGEKKQDRVNINSVLSERVMVTDSNYKKVIDDISGKLFKNNKYRKSKDVLNKPNDFWVENNPDYLPENRNWVMRVIITPIAQNLTSHIAIALISIFLTLLGSGKLKLSPKQLQNQPNLQDTLIIKQGKNP